MEDSFSPTSELGGLARRSKLVHMYRQGGGAEPETDWTTIFRLVEDRTPRRTHISLSLVVSSTRTPEHF